MTVFEIFGRLVLDISGANRSLDNTSTKAETFANNMTKTFKKLATVVGTVFALDKIKDFGAACVQTYAEVAATESAFAQIMGSYSDTATEKMNKVADQTGVVSSRIMPYMTQMTAKFKGLGLDIDTATDLATEGLLMASDAAAFWDKSLDDSMGHLNSFINGNYEGGEAIGLFANDTQMAQRAIEQGVISDAKEWAQLDEATKQLVRLNEAKRQMASGGITGQAAIEADSYANVVANLTAQWKKLKAIIGKPLLEKIVLPAMRYLIKIMPKITTLFEKLAEKFSNGVDAMKVHFEGVFGEDGSIDWEKLGQAVSNMFSDLIERLPGLLQKVGGVISSVWQNAVWPMIQGFFVATFGIELPDWESVAADISYFWGTYIQPVVDGLKEAGSITLKILGFAPWTDEDTRKAEEWRESIRSQFESFSTFVLVCLGIEPMDEATKKKTEEWKKKYGDFKKFMLEFVLPNINETVMRIYNWFEGVKSRLKLQFTPSFSYAPSVQQAAQSLGPAGTSFITNSDSPWAQSFSSWMFGAFEQPDVTPNAEGAVFSKPTIFDTRLGYQMVGEAGAEAVAPINVLQGYVSQAVRSETNGLQSMMGQLLAVMQQVAVNTGAQRQMVLDTGVVVGQLMPGIDTGLGSIAARKERGNI